MQERNDGSFSPTQESFDLFNKLMNDSMELARTRAIHFGTEQELEQVKAKKSLDVKLERLDKRVKKLENLRPNMSDFIEILTPEQIAHFSKINKIE